MSIWQKEISSIYLDSSSKPIKEAGYFNMNVHDNKYITFEKIKPIRSYDSVTSLYGFYLSAGIGGTSIKDLNGLAFQLSGSFAYKTHLLSLSYMNCSTFDLFPSGENGNYMRGSYVGILFGEAIRKKNGMFSTSIGLASSEIRHDMFINTSPYDGYYVSHVYTGISCPIELKGFLLAYNVIGIGFHYSLNLTPGYCPSTFSISLVFGAWNIDR
jgi:hypothetical protein